MDDGEVKESETEKTKTAESNHFDDSDKHENQ